MLGVDNGAAGRTLGTFSSWGEETPPRPSIDHWPRGPRDLGYVRLWGPMSGVMPTVMGVGALDATRSAIPSPYTPSRKFEAESIWASDASVAARVGTSIGFEDGCIVLEPRDLNRTLSDICVRPR